MDYRYALVPNAGFGHVQASLAATLNLRICFAFTAKTVFGPVEEALDIRLVLHNDEHSDNHSENHLPEVHAFEIVFRTHVSKNCQSSEKSAPEDASDRDVFRRDREDNPKGESRKHRERQNRKKNAERGEHAFTAAEPRKAGETVPENHEETSDKRNPGTVISTSGSHLSFAHFLGDERSKEPLNEIHEDNR